MKRLIVVLAAIAAACAQNPISGTDVPAFRVDPNWPRPLPEDKGVQLLVGQVSGIAVDERNGHVWIVHRPATLLADEWNAKEARPVTHRCCRSLPPVVEFDGVVFDANSGQHKRHWGAYGAMPSDDKLPPYDPAKPLARQFGNPVHCVRLSNDGLVYVCDRANNRIQVFDRQGSFKHEFRVEAQTLANGAVWDMVLSQDPAQKYFYVADGANGRIYIVQRADGKQVGSFGRTGRMAGEFKWIHNIAIDRQGNLYTSEVGFGRRIQKFQRVGAAP